MYMYIGLLWWLSGKRIHLPRQETWRCKFDSWLWRSSRKGNGTHSSTLAWRISCTEEPGGLHFIASQTVRQWLSNWEHTYMYAYIGIELEKVSIFLFSFLTHSALLGPSSCPTSNTLKVIETVNSLNIKTEVFSDIWIFFKMFFFTIKLIMGKNHWHTNHRKQCTAWHSKFFFNFWFCIQIFKLCGGNYFHENYRSCCCLVAKLCLTLCNPIDHSLPCLPVLPYFPEFAQTHVHCQWCYPTISSSVEEMI